MKAWGMYVLTMVLGVGLVGGVVWTLAGPELQRAVWVSAAVAVVTQLAAFAVARALREKQLLLGWGLGGLLRLFSLVLYAAIVARLWRAQIAPALLGFAAMLFVTTVVEPIFLKR
ncbi:MAG TPA: hypothetical protein VF483_09155 [Gemmatimonadaceae bacterium]